MHLGVIPLQTLILGPKEQYIEKGSTINLTCIIHAGLLGITMVKSSHMTEKEEAQLSSPTEESKQPTA